MTTTDPASLTTLELLAELRAMASRTAVVERELASRYPGLRSVPICSTCHGTGAVARDGGFDHCPRCDE